MISSFDQWIFFTCLSIRKDAAIVTFECLLQQILAHAIEDVLLACNVSNAWIQQLKRDLWPDSLRSFLQLECKYSEHCIMYHSICPVLNIKRKKTSLAIICDSQMLHPQQMEGKKSQVFNSKMPQQPRYHMHLLTI